MELMTLEMKRLTSCEDRMYQRAMELYKASFPAHEQREALSQQRILSCREYHFNLLYDGERFVGMILYWETDAFLYVEHFCIDPQMRNKSYGRTALSLLQEAGKPILLEIDPPVDELSQRRKCFYERAGFRENPYRHIHPPYHPENSGHLLTVMSFPDTLDAAEYDAFRLYLNRKVMGRMEEQDR